MTQLEVRAPPSACSWDFLVIVAMIYTGIPGFAGIISSFVELIVVSVTMIMRRGSYTVSITSIAGQTQYMIAAACLANALPIIIGVVVSQILGTIIPIAVNDTCSQVNTIVTIITGILQATPFFMSVIYAVLLLNLHKHLLAHTQQQQKQQQLQLQLQQTTQPQPQQVLASSVRRPNPVLIPLVILAVMASFAGQLLIVFSCTKMFGNDPTPPTATAMIIGQLIQLCSGFTMFVCGIVMFRRVKASITPVSDVITQADDASTIRYESEIRATNGVTLVMCIYLFLTNLVLPLTSLICLALSPNLYALFVGIFTSNPSTPLVNGLSVAIMIIVYYVIAK